MRGVRRRRAAFPDLQITIEDLFSTGNAVPVCGAWQGVQYGSLPQWGCRRWGDRWRENRSSSGAACGRLSEAWIVQDNLTMLRQLGIITDEELADAGTSTVATPAP